MESNFLLDIVHKNKYFSEPSTKEGKDLGASLEALAVGQPYNPLPAFAATALFFGANTVMNGIFGYMNRRQQREMMRRDQAFRREQLEKQLQFQRENIDASRKFSKEQQLKGFEFQQGLQQEQFKEARKEAKADRAAQERLQMTRIMEQRRLQLERFDREDKLREESRLKQDELKKQRDVNQRLSQIDQLSINLENKERQVKRFADEGIYSVVNELVKGNASQAIQKYAHSSTVRDENLIIRNKIQERIAKGSATALTAKASDKVKLLGEARDELGQWKQDVKKQGYEASVEGSAGFNSVKNILRRLDDA